MVASSGDARQQSSTGNSMLRILVLALTVTAGPAFAECMKDYKGRTFCGHGPCAKDIKGEVYCAPHRDGTATRDDHGKVVCAMGSCQKGAFGGIYCAVEPGGDALRNSGGGIECFGGCELASEKLCERVTGKP